MEQLELADGETPRLSEVQSLQLPRHRLGGPHKHVDLRMGAWAWAWACGVDRPTFELAHWAIAGLGLIRVHRASEAPWTLLCTSAKTMPSSEYCAADAHVDRAQRRMPST